MPGPYNQDPQGVIPLMQTEDRTPMVGPDGRAYLQQVAPQPSPLQASLTGSAVSQTAQQGLAQQEAAQRQATMQRAAKALMGGKKQAPKKKSLDELAKEFEASQKAEWQGRNAQASYVDPNRDNPIQAPPSRLPMR